METATTTRLLALDGKRRATLGKIGKPEHSHYIVSEEPDGTIVLTPAAVMPEAQARFMADPQRARLLADPAVQDEMEPAPDWFQKMLDED